MMDRRSFLVVLASCALWACGDRGVRDAIKPEETPDRLHVALVLPEEAVLNNVSYTVVHPDNGTTRAGEAKVAASGKFVLQLSALPVGSGYQLNLTGETTQGQACAASESFDIVNRAVITLPLSMRCASRFAEVRGAARADAPPQLTGRGCPDVAGISAAPLDVPVGAAFAIEGFSTSPAPLRWSFPGLVAAPYAWKTSAFCTRPGATTLLLETIAPRCPVRSESIEITCSEDAVAHCGNGLVDAGEECDDGNLAAGDGCSECRRESPSSCAVNFPCQKRTTFCVGKTQIRAARSIACAELCGSDECVGEGCGAAGPVIDCPEGQVCVDDESLPYWQEDAFCMPVPSDCENALCPANYGQCAAGAPASCSAACAAGYCCTWRANDWVRVAIDCDH